MVKLCPKFGETKPLEEFHKDRSKRLGVQVYCKECIRQTAISKHAEDCSCLGCAQRFIDDTGLKRCPKCGEVKSLDEFYKKASGRPQSYCMQCASVVSNKNRKARLRNRTPEERVRWNLARRLANYNLTEHAFTQMLDSQDGACICGTHIDVASAYIDHDHACCPREGSCGQCVRGLLCRNCNTALGLLKDDPNSALALANYLMRFEDVLGQTTKGALKWA